MLGSQEPRVGVALADLVDSVAHGSGAWVFVERARQILCHGVGAGPAPAPLVQALLTKSSSPVRAAVQWTGRTGIMRGAMEGVPVRVAEVGDGATAWFIGGEFDKVSLPLLRDAVHGAGALPTDPIVHELLQPTGPSRGRPAPPARLVVLTTDHAISSLARAAARAVGALGIRLHTDDRNIIAALPVDGSASATTAAILKNCPDAVAGTAVTPPGATDWKSTYALAVKALAATRSLNRSFADPADPSVAADIIAHHAGEAVAELLQQLPTSPLERLADHDARSSTDLIATLGAWCDSGFEIPATATVLQLHVNTVRYRLRRVSQLSGLDLTEPRQRLAAQLLLQARHPERRREAGQAH